MTEPRPTSASLVRARVRRTAYAFFHLNDGGFLDIAGLLAGRVRIKRMRHVCAISILKGEETPISLADLRLLFRISSDGWTPVDELAGRQGLTVARIRQFADRGFVVTDEPTGDMKEMLRRDEALSSGAWNIYAALYHFMTRWQDVNLGLRSPMQAPKRSASGRSAAAEEIDSEEFLRKLTARHGIPPRHFHSVKRPAIVHELPLVKRRHPLYDILKDRMTRRAFDRRRPMTIPQLATLLYYVYGCHGYAEITKDIVGLKKTSPSGGGLHPTEVYPLIVNVKRMRPGLYHYNVRNHSLDLLKKLTRADAIALADEFTAGQGFPMDAAALFLMTSRFYRNFWKYRMHRKAYSVLLMDVAHLSQTFYLVCAELGLGAFVTAAVNHVNIERHLRLDGFTEGAIAICGAGAPAAGDNDVDPQFLPYIPRKTRTPAATAPTRGAGLPARGSALG